MNKARIIVAGIGPGSAGDMTPAVLDAVRRSDVVIGYKYYFQFIEPHVKPAAAEAIERLTLARELWKGLGDADARRFFSAILDRCYAACAPVYPMPVRSAAPVSVSLAEKCSLAENAPAASLTILLLDEDGNVFEA